MTAQEWQTENSQTLNPHNGNPLVLWIPDTLPNPGRRDLFHLSDFAVASVIGGSIWLVRRGSFAGAIR